MFCSHFFFLITNHYFLEQQSIRLWEWFSANKTLTSMHSGQDLTLRTPRNITFILLEVTD